MSDNPYAAPQHSGPSYAGGSNDGERLRQIAVWQKTLIYGVLCNILLFGGGIAAGMTGATKLVPVLQVLSLCLSVVMLYFMFKLAQELYGTIMGVVCTILLFFPCISLITLLVVVSRASKDLQKAGYKVGLMGANLSDFQ